MSRVPSPRSRLKLPLAAWLRTGRVNQRPRLALTLSSLRTNLARSSSHSSLETTGTFVSPRRRRNTPILPLENQRSPERPRVLQTRTFLSSLSSPDRPTRLPRVSTRLLRTSRPRSTSRAKKTSRAFESIPPHRLEKRWISARAKLSIFPRPRTSRRKMSRTPRRSPPPPPSPPRSPFALVVVSRRCCSAFRLVRYIRNG